MDNETNEVAQMGGPVLLDTVYDSIIKQICDKNQEINTQIGELGRKIVFISVDYPGVPKGEEEAKEPQGFADTDLSKSLKELLVQSEANLNLLLSVSSSIVS